MLLKENNNHKYMKNVYPDTKSVCIQVCLFFPSGSESGGFSFTVTDGDHTSPLHRFVVAVRQLTISMEVRGELLVFPGTLPLGNSISIPRECQRVPER